MILTLSASAQSGAPLTSEGVPLRAYGQKAADSSARDAAMATAASDDLAVLPPIPGELRGPDTRSWWQRRKDRTREAAERKGAEQAAAAAQPQQQPRPTNIIREAQGTGQARADVAPAASSPAPMPVSTVASYSGPSAVPLTPEGRPLRAFGSEPRQTPGFVQRATDVGRDIDPNASKFAYTDPLAREAASSRDVYAVTPVASPDGGAGNVADPTPLISNLQGIVLVPQQLKVRQDGARGVQGILNDGVLLPPKVEEVFAGGLNQPLSLASLDAMVRQAVAAYRESDMPVVDVLVPEQQIQSGVLQLVIIEGRLGQVMVEGNTNTDSEFLRKQISTRPGEIINESEMIQDLAWMNKNPFRSVDMIYSPGADYGSTDVILRTNDVRPFSVYAGYEDSGNELTGLDRFLAGVNWGGPLFFSNENTLSYQYVSDFDFSGVQGHSGVWTSYLPWRHHLTLLGSYVTQDAFIAVDDQLLEVGGEDQQGSVRYAMPLPVASRGRIAHDWELGFDYKSSNNSLLFNQLEVFDTTTNVIQFSVGYNLLGRDRYGMTKLDSEVVVSPGGLSSKNSDEAFRSQRGGADSTYVYGRAAIERNTNLPRQFSLITRLEGQLSSTNLLSSETLGAGGYDTVRGFDQRLVRGDNGVVVNLELRTPSLSMANMVGFQNMRDGLQFLTFYDYGYLAPANRLEGEPSHFDLGSVGVGLRYQLDTHLSVRLDYGYQVNEGGFEDDQDGRIHVGGRASF